MAIFNSYVKLPEGKGFPTTKLFLGEWWSCLTVNFAALPTALGRGEKDGILPEPVERLANSDTRKPSQKSDRTLDTWENHGEQLSNKHVLNAQSVFTIQCPCSSWMVFCFDTFGYILLVARINPHVFLVAIQIKIIKARRDCAFTQQQVIQPTRFTLL
jgi:hypothetical protein